MRCRLRCFLSIPVKRLTDVSETSFGAQQPRKEKQASWLGRLSVYPMRKAAWDSRWRDSSIEHTSPSLLSSSLRIKRDFGSGSSNTSISRIAT
ncbi:hypothetical protein LINPERHAP2_LOCUS24735 [Linum perenne]